MAVPFASFRQGRSRHRCLTGRQLGLSSSFNKSLVSGLVFVHGRPQTHKRTPSGPDHQSCLSDASFLILKTSSPTGGTWYLFDPDVRVSRPAEHKSHRGDFMMYKSPRWDLRHSARSSRGCQLRAVHSFLFALLWYLIHLIHPSHSSGSLICIRRRLIE